MAQSKYFRRSVTRPFRKKRRGNIAMIRRNMRAQRLLNAYLENLSARAGFSPTTHVEVHPQSSSISSQIVPQACESDFGLHMIDPGAIEEKNFKPLDLPQNYFPLSSDHNYCSLSSYNFVAVKEDQLETTASSTSPSATLLHHIKTEEEDPLNLDEKPTFEDMESHLCDIHIKIERDNFKDVIRRDGEFDESAPGPSGIHCFSIKNEIIEEPWQCCEGNADPEFETVFCDTVKLEVELGDVVIKSDVDS